MIIAQLKYYRNKSFCCTKMISDIFVTVLISVHVIRQIQTKQNDQEEWNRIVFLLLRHFQTFNWIFSERNHFKNYLMFLFLTRTSCAVSASKHQSVVAVWMEEQEAVSLGDIFVVFSPVGLSLVSFLTFICFHFTIKLYLRNTLNTFR